MNVNDEQVMPQSLKIVRPGIDAPVLWLCLFLLGSCLAEAAAPATVVPTVPISGTNQAAIPSLDKVMLGFVEKIKCTAGTLAISRRGQLLYERSYGWLDQQHKIVAPVNAYFGIASCEKPITAAAVRKLAAEGKLNLESPLFSTLGIHPAGKILDRRVTNITFEEVLEHRAGWGGDIGPELTSLAVATGGHPPFSIPTLLGQAMSRRLEDEPGEVTKYSNFGFDALRYTVSYESQMTPGDYYREKLLQRSTCKDVGQPWELTMPERTSRAVWNLRSGGPVYASSKYLCAFMEEYWLTGRPRDRGIPTWWMYGTYSGSTAIMAWEPNGINIAAVFNGRNETTHDEIRAALEVVVSQVLSESPYRFSPLAKTPGP